MSQFLQMVQWLFMTVNNLQTSVMLELSGQRSNPLLASLQGLLWPRVVPPDWVLSMGQIELFVISTELFETKLFFLHVTVYSY